VVTDHRPMLREGASECLSTAVHRYFSSQTRCQLIKLCSENATFYRRQSVVYRQWHPVRIAGHIAADPIMA